ncbi:MAG: flavin reductase family protein [Woeseia sp.]
MPTEPVTSTPQGYTDLRRALGSFATGVTVVTCCDAEGRPCGITVNSFSSVSLDPPLVLWNISRVSNSLEAFLNAGKFVINILAAHQQDAAAHFAKSDHRLFDNVDYVKGPEEVPLLPGTLGHFECSSHQVYDGGDHYIIVGRIDRFSCSAGEPLLFYAGRYAALAKPA